MFDTEICGSGAVEESSEEDEDRDHPEEERPDDDDDDDDESLEGKRTLNSSEKLPSLRS